jgi:hypothetical protein
MHGMTTSTPENHIWGRRWYHVATCMFDAISEAHQKCKEILVGPAETHTSYDGQPEHGGAALYIPSPVTVQELLGTG